MAEPPSPGAVQDAVMLSWVTAVNVGVPGLARGNTVALGVTALADLPVPKESS